jgi:hypothetical protein
MTPHDRAIEIVHQALTPQFSRTTFMAFLNDPASKMVQELVAALTKGIEVDRKFQLALTAAS